MLTKDESSIAKCRGTDPKIFFPDDAPDDAPEKYRNVDLLREICGRCEVKIRCLEEALSKPEEYGFWGGTTASERKRIRHKMHIA